MAVGRADGRTGGRADGRTVGVGSGATRQHRSFQAQGGTRSEWLELCSGRSLPALGMKFFPDHRGARPCYRVTVRPSDRLTVRPSDRPTRRLVMLSTRTIRHLALGVLAAVAAACSNDTSSPTTDDNRPQDALNVVHVAATSTPLF